MNEDTLNFYQTYLIIHKKLDLGVQSFIRFPLKTIYRIPLYYISNPLFAADC